MMKSKIHRARVTGADLEYEGSIEIDTLLLEAANIIPNEMVQVLNLMNGERFETYAIEGKRGAGAISVNGAAARLVHEGDLLIILSSTWLDEEAARRHRPVVVKVDEKNRLLAPSRT
jgi:aspartate 1-decarboxylase